jgi:hypothetical protein
VLFKFRFEEEAVARQPPAPPPPAEPLTTRTLEDKEVKVVRAHDVRAWLTTRPPYFMPEGNNPEPIE